MNQKEEKTNYRKLLMLLLNDVSEDFLKILCIMAERHLQNKRAER